MGLYMIYFFIYYWQKNTFINYFRDIASENVSEPLAKHEVENANVSAEIKPLIPFVNHRPIASSEDYGDAFDLRNKLEYYKRRFIKKKHLVTNIFRYQM